MKTIPALFVAIIFNLFIQVGSGVTLLLEGAINEVDAASYPGVFVGDAYQLRVDYDLTLVDNDPSSDFGNYTLPSGAITLTVAGLGVVFESISGSINTTASSSGRLGEVSILGDERDFGLILIFQDDAIPSIIDDSLPNPFPQLSDFSFAVFGIITNGVRTSTGFTPNSPELSGSVSSITIPEPQVSLLIMIGCFSGVIRRRSSQNNRENKAEKLTPHRS